MCRCFVLLISLLLIDGYRAFSFEIEKSNDDYNIVFVKNKRAVSNNQGIKTKGSVVKKTPLDDNKNINSAIVRTKVDGDIVKSSTSSDSKMYASATGNISVEDANKLLKTLIGMDASSTSNQTKKSNSKTTKNKKNAVVTTKKNTQTKKTGTSKVVVSYSGDSIVMDSEICKMVARNDVVNVKKTLSMMKYEPRYVNWRCEYNTPLLLLAVEHSNLLVAKLLIEKGADVNLVDDAGVSPLHWIARNGNDATIEMFALFISNDNIAVNIRDIEGYTPLMRAVEFENVDIVGALLEKQSDIYIKNNYGESAIKLARKRLEAKKDNDDKSNIEKIIRLLETNI